MIPILNSNDERVILWGITVYESYVTAQLGYFGESIFAPAYRVGDFLLELPELVKYQNFPTRVQNIKLPIIKS